jgi:transposase-like protein
MSARASRARPCNAARDSAGGAARGPQAAAATGGLGVRADGTRQLLGFTRSTGKCQVVWEGLLHNLHRRGLDGHQLQLIVTGGCAGLAAALQTVYLLVAHQRC